ncbi:MAG: sensor histidine kinase [Eubacteriales bacterium]|nr:sensor histidine kinase [Eubacteriales bacterium]
MKKKNTIQARWNGLVRDWPISAILMEFTVGMVALSLLLGALIFVTVYRRSLIQNMSTQSAQIAEQASNTVRSYQDGLRNSVELIRSSYRLGSERDKRLNTIVSVRPEIIAVTAYEPETGELLNAWTGDTLMKPYFTVNLSFTSSNLPETGEAFRISPPHVESFLLNSYPWVVSISMRAKDYNGKERILVLDSNFSEIASYINNIGIGRHGYCFIINDDGNIIYHPQQQLIFAGLKEEDTVLLSRSPDGSLAAEDAIYTIQSLPDSNWRIVTVGYIDEIISESLQKCIVLLVVLLLMVVLAAFLSSFVLTRLITGPTHELILAMRTFEKKASSFHYTPIEGSSEMMELSDSFGHMVLRIQELMTRVRNEEIALRKTELRALQAQINPHFLYNTLDSIAWMCEDGRSREAVSMVNALARLFRISISKGHELIPIEKELEHAKSYLQIQKVRYKNQFEYIFEAEEQCLSYYCNKITLQPLIENAIYHGLNRMIDEGLIRIRVACEGEDVILSVSDNGVGMTEEQCRDILEGRSESKGGIGLKNVNERVKIYFGEAYGMRIESEPDEGTTVSIRMPKVERGAYGAR